ncbi:MULTISPECIES: antiterminator Q family protein [unclassified Arsenophonus]|uniref:antiterminator Q family protein n=1 Tax=unclassified Arsenophonus TaxID=2627083 RepID=UPI00285F97B5|nr:antiterminator Q family protein [Arsenophonus sp.]MDR5615558.1 antiterminator Q family protein [Arsenophonus sp.]
MKAVKSLELTKAQYDWVNHWLELWGAWVYSGELDKWQFNIIWRFMKKAKGESISSRPMCRDDEGLIISEVVNSVMRVDERAYNILLSYYVHGKSKLSIATYYHKTAKPRRMMTRAGGRWKRPSPRTCRREIDDIFNASLYLIHNRLLTVMKNKNSVAKVVNFT